MILTLRPNAAGDETSIPSQEPASGYHWDKVDEVGADEGATGVYDQGYPAPLPYKRDLYNLPAHSVGSGTINFIKVYIRGLNGTADNARYYRPCLRTGGTTYDGTEVGGLGSSEWVTWSQTWTTNPKTGVAWTWDDIDALQIGIGVEKKTAGSPWCTQVYVEVDYTPAGGGGATQEVTLNPGESKAVSFEATPQEARTYQVLVNGLTGSFVARPPLPEWVVAVSDNSPSDWLLIGPSPSGARDGDFNSYAAVRVPPLSWSSFLELTFDKAYLATKYRYKALYHYDGINVIDIDAYYNGAWQHVYQGPFADRLIEVKSLGGTYSVTKIRARFYNSYAGEDGSWLYELQLGTGALVAQPDFYMPAVMDVVVTDGSILNMYWNCKFSVVITNKESVVGTHIINWWDNAGVIAGSKEITLNPGETYTWQWNQLADFRRLAAPYTMQLSGDWVTNNLSKGDARP